MRLTPAQLAQTAAGRRNGYGKPTELRWSIGIDPGKNTGFAVWNKQTQQFDKLVTVDFWQAVTEACVYDVDKTTVVVEVPKTKTRFGGKSGGHTESVNVGMVIREAQLIAEGLRRKGYQVIEKHPEGKIDAALFKKLTGYQGRTNNHNRDAGMLAYRYG